MIGVYIFEGYFILGLLFAVAFLVKGASTLDEDLKGSPVKVRLILLPGAILLWPILLMKWIRA